MSDLTARSRKATEFFRNPENGLSVLIALLLLLFIIKCISVALTTTLNFDGSIFTQVAQNLASHFNYATNYQGTLFDKKVTTGLPVILPEAVLFYLFGESFESALMVSAIYLILLAFAIVYYLKNCVKISAPLVLLAFVMFFGTRSLFVYGFGLFGEIPTLFYLILVLIFLNKFENSIQPKYLLGAGVSLGIGYQTKTVSLIIVPAIIFAATFDFLVKRQLTLKDWSGVKRFFQQYLLLPAGFFLCIFVFEIYRLISMGFVGFQQWWQEELRWTLSMAGVTQGLIDTEGTLPKLVTHLKKLASFWQVDKIYIVMILGLLGAAFIAILAYGVIHFLKKRKPEGTAKLFFSADILVLITMTLSYFGWWLLILHTQHAWERYIFNAYILFEMCLVIGASFLMQIYKGPAPGQARALQIVYRVFMFSYIFCLASASIYFFFNSGNYRISFKDTSEKNAILDAAQFIRQLPQDAVIYGYDWWQAPVVAFASGKTFENLLTDLEMRKPGAFTDKYLVVDSYATYLDSGASSNILDQYDHQLVFSREPEKLFIYKLNSRDLFAYNDFSESEKEQVSYSKIQFFKKKLNVFVRNVYVNEKNDAGKWAQDVSAYLFKYRGESKLIIDLWIPNLADMERQPFELDIYANRASVYHFEADKENSYQIEVPLQNITGDTLEITLICNTRYKDQGDARPFSYLLWKIELVN